MIAVKEGVDRGGQNPRSYAVGRSRSFSDLRCDTANLKVGQVTSRSTRQRDLANSQLGDTALIIALSFTLGACMS